MTSTIYETYPVKDQILPFHFHLEDYQPNIDYPNWHNELELLFCINEGGIVRCEGTQYEFKNNDVICINPGQLHSSSTNTKFLYYCLIINSDFCESNGIEISKLEFRTYIRDSELSNKFQKLVNAYEKLKSTPSENHIYNIYKADIRLCVLDILIHLSKNHLLSTNDINDQHKSSTKYVKKALEYIAENITQEFTLDDIAKHIRVSKFHLAREFKLITGHTVIEQINILKCNEARKLIASGMSVTNAAMQLGYNDLPYFSQMFKKHMGVSPSKIRFMTVERL